MAIFEFRLPDLAEGLTEAEIKSVLVREGDDVTEDAPLLEVETDKATVEIPSPVAGRVRTINVRAGAKANVGDLLITLETAIAASSQQTASDQSGSTIEAAPATRQMARELKVDLALVKGTGPGGRILPGDVKAAAGTGGRPEEGAEGITGTDRWGAVEKRPVGRIRRAIAERMALSAQMIPAVTHFDRADITDLMGELKERRAAGREITLTSVLVRAAALALTRHPTFNATIDMKAGEIVVKRYCNIGVATATRDGLLVPVIKNAERKSVGAIAGELGPLIRRVRDREAISPDYFGGGSFTITNVGGARGTGNIPLINYPEVAILGVAQAREEPCVHGGRIAARLLLPISLTFDHRIADGADGAAFAAEIATMLEKPEKLIEEMA